MTLSNGLGGFADGGRAYVLALNGTDETPMPWTNVIANPRFGTMITVSGSAHTWSENSRENRLTPFANDPTSDPTAEALFIRDDESGDFWSPTPGPLVRTAGSGRVVVRHSAGLTHFSRHTHGISHTLDVFVDTEDPVKFSRLTIGQRRRPRPNAQHLRVQRVGARAATRRPSAVRRHRARHRHRCGPGKKCLQPGMGTPRRVLARKRSARFGDRRPLLVHRAQRQCCRSRRRCSRRSSPRQLGDGAGSVRSASGEDCAATRRAPARRVPPWRRDRSRTCRASDRTSRAHRRRRLAAQSRAGVVERHTRARSTSARRTTRSMR